MTPTRIIDRLSDMGVCITTDGDDLSCMYSGEVSEDVFDFLCEHKTALVEYLKSSVANVECSTHRTTPYDLDQLFGETDFVQWWRSWGDFPKDGETLMVDTLDLAHQACALLHEILPTYRTAVRRRGKIWVVVLAVA
jgi:hypothetical protein